MDEVKEAAWIREHRDEAQRRRHAGGDPYERQARRQALREWLMITGATVTMGLLVSTFYAVLIR
jgi:hypothetical protein